MVKTSKRLVGALIDATRSAFSEVRAAHPKEHFYVFALFSESGDDRQPTCHSEEALERVVARQRPKKGKKSASLDARALRFFAEEFEYHQAGEELDVQSVHESLSAVLFLDEKRIAAGGRDVDEGPPISVWTLQ